MTSRQTGEGGALEGVYSQSNRKHPHPMRAAVREGEGRQEEGEAGEGGREGAPRRYGRRQQTVALWRRYILRTTGSVYIQYMLL